MALSYTTIAGGDTSGFAIDTGDGTKTDVTLSKEYPAGGYQVSSANNNQGLFIFFGASDGTPAGGTSSKSIVATKAFNKITIIGVTANDLITFTYKETATLNAVGTSSSYSGAVVTSFSPNQASSIDDTIILNGAALGTSVTVKFTGANGTPLNAKSITRVSDTQLIVTRPDTMPGDQDPYKITVQNPGIEPAVSTNVLSQPLYAGSAPTWSTASTLPAFTKNVSYTQQLLASDPDGTAITYSFVNGSLPAGLTYAANSSTISGTPTGSTSATFTIRATESSGRYTDRVFTLPDAYPVFTTGATLTPYTKNVSYSATIVATDDSGVAPALSVVGTMPNGLSFNALTGSVSGIPTTSTNQTFTIRATDANGSTTDQTFTVPNTGPTWTTASGYVATFTKNVAFSTTLSATDDGTLTYTIISGSLPTGLTLNSSTGVISGTATTSTHQTFTVRVQDDAGNYVDRSFTLSNLAPTWVSTSPLPAFTKNVAYSNTLSVTDDGTKTYSITTGLLPTGLTLNSSTGVISGTPSDTQSQTFTIRVTDDAGSYADRQFTIPNIGSAAPVWTTSGAITASSYNNSYSYQLVATDDSGNAPTYSIASGSLPQGLSLSSSGLISGTATYGGSTSYSFTVNATDQNGTVTTSSTITISHTGNGGTLYTSPGTYTFTVPNGVTSINAVAIGGGGGAGSETGNGGGGGSGGGCAYGNSISVTPGQQFTVVVGLGGGNGTGQRNGGDSYLRHSNGTDIIRAYGGLCGYDGGGSTVAGGSYSVNGSYASGGGWTGGYGGAGNSSQGQAGGNGTGTGWIGSAGGGAGGHSSGSNSLLPGAGCVGCNNQIGAQTSTNCSGPGGSGGCLGENINGVAAEPSGSSTPGSSGGYYGGGCGGSSHGASGNQAGYKGGNGGLRIMWGPGRSFPSTNTALNYAGIAETVV